MVVWLPVRLLKNNERVAVLEERILTLAFEELKVVKLVLRLFLISQAQIVTAVYIGKVPTLSPQTPLNKWKANTFG